ncbi:MULTISPECIES: hypothetical protein [unclassified Mesorhizobium]|uniref:hypothetical protein n=1 Tax=unclassified Mesorhizobium TaxID=325217 RepID=UPI00333CB8A2
MANWLVLISEKEKTCVFCRNPVRDPETVRSRSREHVFPFWALKEFDAVRDVIEFPRMEANSTDGLSAQLTEQTTIRRLDLNNFLLGDVCSRCNNGRMEVQLCRRNRWRADEPAQRLAKRDMVAVRQGGEPAVLVHVIYLCFPAVVLGQEFARLAQHGPGLNVRRHGPLDYILCPALDGGRCDHALDEAAQVAKPDFPSMT